MGGRIDEWTDRQMDVSVPSVLVCVKEENVLFNDILNTFNLHGIGCNSYG